MSRTVKQEIAILKRQIESLKGRLEKERKHRNEQMALMYNRIAPICAWWDNITTQVQKKGEK